MKQKGNEHANKFMFSDNGVKQYPNLQQSNSTFNGSGPIAINQRDSRKYQIMSEMKNSKLQNATSHTQTDFNPSLNGSTK